MKIFHTDCREWQGYKPCNKQRSGLVQGCDDCQFHDPIQQNILLIEAGGLGSAFRTSVVTKELRARYPHSLIQWLTNEQSAELISVNIPSVDRVYPTTWENMMILGAQAYFLIINFESSPVYLAFVSDLLLKKKGFVMNEWGNLTLASSLAQELLQLQTDDHFRRRGNKKSMQQLLLEVAGLKWREQTYDLVTKPSDDEWARAFLASHGIIEADTLIGFNIGSSLRHSAKRWPPEYFYKLAKLCLERHPEWRLLILAGQEDIDAYKVIVGLNETHPLNNLVFAGYSNTMSQFVSLVNKIPTVISTDTFGLHVALGLGKKTISFWGPQPENETYSYGRETKISLKLNCAPCFAGTADKCMNPNRLQCMREIEVETVFQALKRKLV